LESDVEELSNPYTNDNILLLLTFTGCWPNDMSRKRWVLNNPINSTNNSGEEHDTDEEISNPK
jgi:hypothetical protein